LNTSKTRDERIGEVDVGGEQMPVEKVDDEAMDTQAQ
jgi:hypothetical protein